MEIKFKEVDLRIRALNCIIENIFWLDDISLENWIDYAALYSKKHWLILVEERLKRIENEE